MQNIILSKTNPADRTKGPEFDELVASIKEKGILMPVLARKLKGGKLEIIAGNRRVAAALKLGIAEKDIPMRIVEMTDEEANEAQIIENLQRKDVHPVDEAVSFRNLVEKHKKDTKEIAARVGKSETYVKNRLLLTDLDPKIQAYVRADKLPLAHAFVVARLDAKDQMGAYKFATRYERVCGLDDLREYVTNHVFHDAMQNPPWKNDAAAKAEIAKVTGIKGDVKTLFGDDVVGKIENPADYARAMAAFLTLKINEYRESGKPLTLVSDEYSTTTKGVKGRGEYETTAYKNCKSFHDAIIVEGRGLGKIIKICTDKGCKAHHPNTNVASSPEEKKRRSAALKAARTKTEKANAEIAKTIAKIKWPLTEKGLETLLALAFDNIGTSFLMPIVKRHGFKPDTKVEKGGWKSRDYRAPLRRLAEEGGTNGKLQMLFELIACDSYGDGVTRNINRIKN